MTRRWIAFRLSTPKSHNRNRSLTEPNRQKSRRKKGFWAQKSQRSQIASDFPSHAAIAFSCLGNRTISGVCDGHCNRKNRCDFGALSRLPSVQDDQASQPARRKKCVHSSMQALVAGGSTWATWHAIISLLQCHGTAKHAPSAQKTFLIRWYFGGGGGGKSVKFSKQAPRVCPFPLRAGSARPNPEMGAPDPENPLFLGVFCAQKGIETMVSDHGLNRGQTMG